MDTDTQLAALAAIELVARQIVDPAQAEDHRAELAVIMANVEPIDVVLGDQGAYSGYSFLQSPPPP